MDSMAKPCIGHTHLKVADHERAIGFLRDVMGMDLIQRYGDQAAFLSWGGYRHDIGLNTWHSAGGTAPEQHHTGLSHVALLYLNRRAFEAIEPCAAAGVKLGLGCDLHGDFFLQKQTHELMLRTQVQMPLEVLRSATSVNAEIVQMQGKLGQIAPGALADMILIVGDPTEDMSVFANPLRSVVCVVKDGVIVRDRMAH